MKESVKKYFGNWYIECDPDDGARIQVLKYAGNDLLTVKPELFKAPLKFTGEYETRPVYGYDDCFPTVDTCTYPGKPDICRDHGELCWQQWKFEDYDNKLIFETDCLRPNVKFRRILEFHGSKLLWKFEVVNCSEEKVIFLHVMHALLPLQNIQKLNLPEYGRIIDEIHSKELVLENSQDLVSDLFNIKSGDYKMLLLSKLKGNRIRVGFESDLALSITFDKEIFPTLGIWWNNAGYPAEEGLERIECAFEPIPGSCSDLSKSFSDGIFLETDPGKSISWEISWEVESKE